MAKNVTSTITSTAKKPLVASRKKYRLSTRDASVEAWSGKNWMRGSMCSRGAVDRVRRSLEPGVRREWPAPLPPSHHHHRHADDQKGRHTTGPDDPHHREAVLPARRVVVEAREQKLICRTADLPIRSLDERQAQIARSVLDAVEVMRQPAVRRHHHDPARVRELPGVRVVGVAEADGPREPRDLRGATREKTTALASARPLVAREIVGLLRARQLRRIPRIETHGDDVELLADREIQRAERARQPVQDLGAQHRALEVVQGQDHRTVPEEVAELDRSAGLV